MEPTSLLDSIKQYGIVTGLGIFAASFLIPKLFAARGEVAEAGTRAAEAGARMDVVELLSARVAKLEQAQEEAWSAFEAERVKRMAAEDRVATLARRVAALEDQIKQLGHTPV